MDGGALTKYEYEREVLPHTHMHSLHWHWWWAVVFSIACCLIVSFEFFACLAGGLLVRLGIYVCLATNQPTHSLIHSLTDIHNNERRKVIKRGQDGIEDKNRNKGGGKQF